MYVEFGANAADTVRLTVSYNADGLTSAKSFNILARQISCFAEWRSVVLLLHMVTWIFFIYWNWCPGPQLTVSSGTREPRAMCSATITLGGSCLRSRSTTTVSEQKKGSWPICWFIVYAMLQFCLGYCKIQWKESSTENPDPFKVGTTTPATSIGGNGDSVCTNAFITIPNLRNSKCTNMFKQRKTLNLTYLFVEQVVNLTFFIINHLSSWWWKI